MTSQASLIPEDSNTSDDPIFQFCIEYFRHLHSTYERERQANKSLSEKLEQFKSSDELLRQNLNDACQTIWKQDSKAVQMNEDSIYNFIIENNTLDDTAKDTSTHTTYEAAASTYTCCKHLTELFEARGLIKQLEDELVRLETEKYNMKEKYDEEIRHLKEELSMWQISEDSELARDFQEGEGSLFTQ
jgi:hypothetical protein